MSFERKTVEPERSPIDSPCQNVEKSSNDGTPQLGAVQNNRINCTGGCVWVLCREGVGDWSGSKCCSI